MKVIKKTAIVLMVIMQIMILSFTTIVHAEEILPTDPVDKISLNHYTELVDAAESVYKVTIQVEARGVEEVKPPAVITFLLDGTASMAAFDGTGISRDVKVREAMVEAFRIFMSDSNPNKENTYVDIIMYGSTAQVAASLTQWASQPSPQIGQLEGYSPASSFPYTTGPGVASEYIPLLNPRDPTKLNPILAQLFYCDYNTLDLKPAGAPGTLDPAYPISNIYFYGNDQASMSDGAPNESYSSRFPIHSYGTAVNGATRRAYQAMSAKLNELETSGDFSEEEMEKAGRYVMILSDGNDASADGTQSYAAALKAPETVTIPAMQMTGGGRMPGSTTTRLPSPSNPPSTVPSPGLNADIWSMVIGTEGYTTPALISREDQWKTSSYLGNQLTGTGIYSLARSMISMAAAPVTDWSLFEANVAPSSWSQYYTQYQQVLDPALFPTETNYFRTSSIPEAKAYFANFALQSSPEVGATNVAINGGIAGTFTAYKYTDPQYAPYTFSTVTGHTPTVTIAGDGTLKWTVGTMDPGEVVTLVYYVQLKPEFQGDGNWYEPMMSLYVSYNGATGKFYKMDFPENLIYSSPKDTSQTEAGGNPLRPVDPKDTLTIDGSIPVSSGSGAGTISVSSNGVSNLTSGSTGAVQAPYTASVTMQPQSATTQNPLQIIDESVDEGAHQVPATGYGKPISFKTIIIIGIAALIIICISKIWISMR